MDAYYRDVNMESVDKERLLPKKTQQIFFTKVDSLESLPVSISKRFMVIYSNLIFSDKLLVNIQKTNYSLYFFEETLFLIRNDLVALGIEKHKIASIILNSSDPHQSIDTEIQKILCKDEQCKDEPKSLVLSRDDEIDIYSSLFGL